MDDHTAIGARMLERIPFLAPVAPLVRSAHERFDGGGYPDGLAGDEIPRGGDDHRHLRRLPRDDLRPLLPQGDGPRGGDPRAAGQRRHPVRPARGRGADRRAGADARRRNFIEPASPPRLPSIACSAMRIGRGRCGSDAMSTGATRTWEPWGPTTSTIVQTSPISHDRRRSRPSIASICSADDRGRSCSDRVAISASCGWRNG